MNVEHFFMKKKNKTKTEDTPAESMHQKTTTLKIGKLQLISILYRDRNFSSIMANDNLNGLTYALAFDTPREAIRQFSWKVPRDEKTLFRKSSINNIFFYLFQRKNERFEG